MTRLFLSFIFVIPLFLRLCYTDLKQRELENIHILLILLSFFGVSVKFSSRLWGFFIPYILTPFYGFGDILLFSVLGFSYGYESLFRIYLISSMIAFFVALYKLIIKKQGLKDSFPYAPCIFIAYIFNFLFLILEKIN